MFVSNIISVIKLIFVYNLHTMYMYLYFLKNKFIKIYFLISIFLIFVSTTFIFGLFLFVGAAELSTFKTVPLISQTGGDSRITPLSSSKKTIDLFFSQRLDDHGSGTQKSFESFAKSQIPLTNGSISTGEIDGCILAIAEIAKCNRGNGTCTVNAVNAYKRRCSPTEDKEILLDRICLRPPSVDHNGRNLSPQDRVFFCQACVGRGLGLEGADRVCTAERLQNPSEGGNKVLTKNGQLSAKISVTRRAYQRLSNNNSIYEIMNNFSYPFFGNINAFAQDDLIDVDVIITALEIKNIGLNTSENNGAGGIVASQNETCTFTYSPGPGWVVENGPGTSQTNNGICSTTVKIKKVDTQTVFPNFFELPIFAQTEPSVGVCVGRACASVNLSSPTQVVTEATTDVLNFFKTRCFFPGQKLSDGRECSSEESLSVKILDFLLALARIVVLLAIVYAGYLLMLGKEKEGRDILRHSIIGLVLVFMIATLVNLVERSISEKSSQPFAEFVTSIVSNFVIPIAASISLVYFVIGGYFVLTAGGNSNQVSKGWSYMRNAIIGLIIVILSFSMAQIITNIAMNFVASI